MKELLVQLMEENLNKVWSERDSSLRIKAIEAIYLEKAALYHVDNITEGREAINDYVTSVLSNTPKEFSFFKINPVVINNNIGRLVWGIGAREDSLVATGMDIAIFEDNKIKSLYVFLHQ